MDDDNLILAPTVPPERGAERSPERPPPELVIPALEACLFVAAEPVSAERLQAVLGITPAALRGALEGLRERLAQTGAGVVLVQIGEGWVLRTDPRVAVWANAIRGQRPWRLSKASLETLAIVAFKQPITKGGVEDIRGVDCSGVLKMLSERGLVRVVGRAEEPGRPLTYGTTPRFLEVYGLRSLADLPTLRDLRQLQAELSEAQGPMPELPDGEGSEEEGG